MNSISHQFQLPNDTNPYLENIFKELADIKFALDQSNIVAITDTLGKIIDVNDQFCTISKYSRSELMGQNHRLLNSEFHSKQFFQNMWRTIGSGQVWRGDIRNKTKDGNYYWVQCTIIPVLDQNGNPDRYISIRNDITERKSFEEQIALLAYYDELTGLPNRRKFNQDIKGKLDNTQNDGTGISVIFIDLDRFKLINDTKGHSFGDIVLKAVASRIVNHLDGRAQMYRLGGDEFTIIFESLSNQEVTREANRLLELFWTPFTIENEDYFLSLSIGVSTFPFNGEDMDSLVKSADLAMYKAKELGGNRVEYYKKELTEDIKKEMSLEHELRKAIEKDELFLVYQPKVNLANHSIIGLEALIRWNHPKLGSIPPSQFIPIAEKTGLIFSISEFVIRRVCEHIIKWKRSGFPPLRVAVNLSPVLFENYQLAHFIYSLLHETGVSPSYLELEITESVMKNPDQAIVDLKMLKSMGLHISIDDFGTGYSSLSHLRRFSIDTLKIDRSFIQEIGNSPADDAMVKTIIDIAHNLKLNVIAEGIETKEQLDYLTKYQCCEGQGYLFSRPITYEKINALICSQN